MQDKPGETSYVRVPVDSLARMRLMEEGDVRALTALHVEEKEKILEENTRLRAALADRGGEHAVETILPDTGAGVTKAIEADAAVYSCLLLAAQQEVDKARQEAADRVSAAEARVKVADQRVEDAEESKTNALASVAEPLQILADLEACRQRADQLEKQLGRERTRTSRLEGECQCEREGRRATDVLLDGDRPALLALPLATLEDWQGRLRRALEAATDAVVEARVTAAREAETAAAEAIIREKEAAGVPIATECTICMERTMDTALDCGHRACATCAAQLAACHACRTPVRVRLRLY